LNTGKSFTTFEVHQNSFTCSQHKVYLYQLVTVVANVCY